MLGFVVPFKSKAKSNDWEKDSLLLKRTLESTLNQVDENFRCYVVYSDMPLYPIYDSKIEWVHFPFDFLELEQIADLHTFIRRPNAHPEAYATRFLDQGKRVLFGCTKAINNGCDYIMMLDADDLVSNRLSQFVNMNNRKENFGWFVSKGYLYRDGGGFLQKVPKGMNQMHGSVNIVRSNLIPMPDFNDRRLEPFVFFAHHTYLYSQIENLYGKQLQEIPFYATIYVVHNSGWSTMHNDLTSFSFRKLVKSIVRVKFIDKAIKEEFKLSFLPTLG